MPLVYTPFYATIEVLKDTSDMKWMNVFLVSVCQISSFGTKYSKMDQVKFMEDSL